MQVICLEEPAFYALVEEVVARLKEQGDKPKERWVDMVEAKRLLNIKSKATLQKMRDEGRIRFSQAHRKGILYDRQSIEEFLDRNAQNTF